MPTNLVATPTIPATVQVPADTELVTAASVEPGFQALYNFTQSVHEGQINVVSGNNVEFNSGANITGDPGSGIAWSGVVVFNGTGANSVTISNAEEVNVDELTINTLCDVESPAVLTVKNGAALTMNSTSILSTQGRIKHRERATMTDADQTLDVVTADQWELSPTPAAPRTIKLKTSNAANDEIISLFIRNVFSSTDGVQYTIQREDSTTLAEFVLINGIRTSVWARFRFVGSTWTLDENVGYMYNPTEAVYYGCLPAP